MSEVLDRVATAADVDEYGDIARQIKRLEERRELLKAKILSEAAFRTTDGVVDGNNWRAKVVIAERATVDWKTVAERAGASRQLIAAHTAHTIVRSVRTEVL
jgi:hypothetical protein